MVSEIAPLFCVSFTILMFYTNKVQKEIDAFNSQLSAVHVLIGNTVSGCENVAVCDERSATAPDRTSGSWRRICKGLDDSTLVSWLHECQTWRAVRLSMARDVIQRCKKKS